MHQKVYLGPERSGKITGIPVAGAFGGGDGAMQKLGRPFVPKLFQGTGQLSTGADTMMSVAMSRHNVDQEYVDNEDILDPGSILSSKIGERPRVPRGFKMKHYLHDIPLSEINNISDSEIAVLFEGIQDFISRLGNISFDTIASTIAPYIPFGDLYFGYKAIKEVGDIQKLTDTFAENLEKTFGIKIDLYTNEDNEILKISKKISELNDDERSKLQKDIIEIGLITYNALRNAVMSIPLELVGLAGFDMLVDTMISATSFLYDNESIIDEFLKSSNAIKSTISALRTSNDIIEKIEDFFGTDIIDLVKIAYFLENMSKLYNIITQISQSDTQSSHLASSNAGLDIFAEASRKKKKLTSKNEMNVASNVAGFTGPLSGPSDPKDFYKRMSKSYHGEFVNDPSKIKRRP